MKKILVIDDKPTIRRLVARTLRHRGYEVLEADDGPRGLELARTQWPDLVLSDIMMGTVDGFAVLQNLRSHPATADIPVILMTGVGDNKHMRQGMDLGADDFLPKPFTADTLRKAVRARLERQQSRRDRALRENQRLLKVILDNTPDPAWLKDAQGRYLTGNKPLAQILRCRLEDLPGKTLIEVFPGGAASLIQGGREAMATGKSVRSECIISDAAGQSRWFDTIETPIFNEHSEIIGVAGIARDMTERKQMEAARRESEARYHSLFENMLEGFARCRMIFDHDRPQDFEYLEVNSAFERMTGLKNVVGKKATEVIPGIRQSDPRLFEIYGRVALTGKTERFEAHVNALGIWCSIAVYSYQKEQFVTIFDNITDRKTMEADLRESEKRYREFLDAQDDGVVIADAEQRFTFVNPAMGRILRLPADQLAGRDLRSFLDDEQRRAFDRQIELRRTGRKSTYEIKVRTATGEFRQVAINATAQMDRDGRFGGTFAVLRDITERKQTEEKLRLQTSALAATANGIVITDRRGLILWVNPAFTGLTGYASDEVIGQTPAVLKSGTEDPFFYKNMWDTILRGDVWKGELVNRRKDGSHFCEEMTITPVLGPAGEILNFVAVKQDISQRKMDEKELRTREESFRALADNVPDAVARIDRSMRFVYGNRALARDIGREPAAFLGKTGEELKLPTNGQWCQELARVFQTGESHSFEFQFERNDGIVHRETRLVPECSATGEVEFVLAVTRDVTEQKEAEKERQLFELQLRQGQKMEAIGQLAAGIAHEINTPTQYVGDNTRFLKDAFDSIVGLLRSHTELLAAARQNALTPELLEQAEESLAASDIDYLYLQIPQAIQETLEGVERVTKIVRAMKEFSHPGSKEKSAADINRAVETTVTVARNEWKYVADLKLDLDPALPLVPCFIGEFNQVILNLIVNAAHAIGDKGKQNPGARGNITIQTRREGNLVAVRVSDDGTGIPEAHRSRIFEPFFTTKEVGKGSGQGLAFVYTSIFKKHGGSVTFETETGKGTTFIVRLPLTLQTPPTEPLPAKPREGVSVG